MGLSVTCAKPARVQAAMKSDATMSCSSTPKSRIAVTDPAWPACPSPGSEKSTAPSGVNTRCSSASALGISGM